MSSNKFEKLLADERTGEVVLEKEANKQCAFAEEQKIIVEVKYK